MVVREQQRAARLDRGPICINDRRPAGKRITSVVHHGAVVISRIRRAIRGRQLASLRGQRWSDPREDGEAKSRSVDESDSAQRRDHSWTAHVTGLP